MNQFGNFARDHAVLDSVVMDNDCREYESIRQHYLFSGLDQGDFDSLIPHVTRATLEKGEVLFHSGDVANHFYFVHSGQLELSMIAATGQKKVLEVIGPDRTFAEAVAFMRDQKYPVSCEALSDSVMGQRPNREYVNRVSSHPEACTR